MGRFVKTSEKEDIVKEISFKDFFVPLTTFKAIFWIVVISIVVYANMLINGFVWDDIGQIVNNNDIHSLSNISTFFFSTRDIHGNLVKIHAVYYRPLMASVYTVMYTLFGANAFFFHTLSLILHIAITLLVFFLFKRFFKTPIAFFLSVIFLSHPLNAETVDYIGALNDLMYAFFGMLSIHLLQRNVISVKRILILSVLLFLSLLSKEPGFLFLMITLFYIFLYYRKYFYMFLSASIAICVLYIILRTSFYTGIPQDQVLGFSPYLHMSFMQHLLNVPKLFFYYIGNFFFPINFAIAQHWSVQTITISDFYFPFIIFSIFLFLNILLFISKFKQREMHKEVLFFSVWFWIGMGLYMQFVVLDMTVADRWFYFPMIGLLGLLGIFLQTIQIRRRYRIVVFSIAILCIILFSIRTIVRNTNWNNEYILYSHDLAIANNSFDLENQLGNVYFNQGNFAVAKSHYERSIALWSCSDATNNLGYLYQTIGDLVSAEKEYLNSVHCGAGGGYKDYGNLVLLLYRLHNYDLAEKYTKVAIQKFPNIAGLYFILGIVDDKKGDRQNALKNLATGYQLSQDPQIANAYQLIEQNKPVDLPTN